MVETASGELIQYVISTHSLDFLEFLLKSNPELIQVIRLYRNEKDSKIDYEILSGKEAYGDLENLKMDLRGI
jgi:hypothetical protein